jgi:hypothetical protein
MTVIKLPWRIKMSQPEWWLHCEEAELKERDVSGETMRRLLLPDFPVTGVVTPGDTIVAVVMAVVVSSCNP